MRSRIELRHDKATISWASRQNNIRGGNKPQLRAETRKNNITWNTKRWPSAPDVHGPVCEKWLAGWCQASGARNSQPLVILDALHAAAPLVNGRGDQAAGGGKTESAGGCEHRAQTRK